MQHLIRQAAPSGHGALAGVWQHAQCLDFAGAIIFSQSLMAADISSLGAAAATRSAGMVKAAQAEAIGARTNDSAIQTAKTRRKGKPFFGRQSST